MSPHVALHPCTDACLLLQPTLAAWYDVAAKTFTPLAVHDSTYGSASTQLLDDTVLVVGGSNTNTTAVNATARLSDGLHLVRVFDSNSPSTSTVVASMPSARWRPSLCTLPDGNVLIVGEVLPAELRAAACCLKRLPVCLLWDMGSWRGCIRGGEGLLTACVLCRWLPGRG